MAALIGQIDPVHVYPFDEDEHDIEGGVCVCRPRLERVSIPVVAECRGVPAGDPEIATGLIVIHRDRGERAAEAS